jgi:protein-tyrosine phosphatase
LLKRSRLASKEAEYTAKKHFSIDMSSHRSTCVYDLELDKYDFIVIFDDHNFRFFNQNFSPLLEKVVYLMPEKEIDDPYSKDKAYFLQKFTMIGSSIDQLIDRS